MHDGRYHAYLATKISICNRLWWRWGSYLAVNTFSCHAGNLIKQHSGVPDSVVSLENRLPVVMSMLVLAYIMVCDELPESMSTICVHVWSMAILCCTRYVISFIAEITNGILNKHLMKT